jgi:hypothetical protein
MYGDNQHWQVPATVSLRSSAACLFMVAEKCKAGPDRTLLSSLLVLVSQRVVSTRICVEVPPFVYGGWAVLGWAVQGPVTDISKLTRYSSIVGQLPGCNCKRVKAVAGTHRVVIMLFF